MVRVAVGELLVGACVVRKREVAQRPVLPESLAFTFSLNVPECFVHVHLTTFSSNPLEKSYLKDIIHN